MVVKIVTEKTHGYLIQVLNERYPDWRLIQVIGNNTDGVMAYIQEPDYKLIKEVIERLK